MTKGISRRDVLRGASAALCSGLTGPACAQARAGEWPGFRGPNHNGVLDEPLTLRPGGPQKLWEAQVGDGNSSVAIAQGKLYVASSGNPSTICLDAVTGRPVWKLRVETHTGHSTPAVENGRVYALTSLGSGDATAYCWDAASGEQIWKRALPRSSGDRQYLHAGSARLWEDVVLLNAGGGAALRKTTGEPAWVHPGFPGLATPVVYQAQGRPCVALFGGDRCSGREARTGRELWQVPWKTELAVNACDPIIFENKLFLCSDYGRGRSLYDISGAQPRLLWEFGAGRGSSFSSGFYHGGQLYCFAEGSFCCLDIATGVPKWRTGGANAVLLIGGTVILVRHSGEVRFGRLAATGFQDVSTFDSGMRDLKAVPAYSAGRLYLRSETGHLTCFQIGAAR